MFLHKENEINLIASQIDYDSDVVKTWFSEKAKQNKKEEKTVVTETLSSNESKQVEHVVTVKEAKEEIQNDNEKIEDEDDEEDETEVFESTLEEIPISYEPVSIQDDNLLFNLNKNQHQKTQRRQYRLFNIFSVPNKPLECSTLMPPRKSLQRRKP